MLFLVFPLRAQAGGVCLLARSILVLPLFGSCAEQLTRRTVPGSECVDLPLPPPHGGEGTRRWFVGQGARRMNTNDGGPRRECGAAPLGFLTRPFRRPADHGARSWGGSHVGTAARAHGRSRACKLDQHVLWRSLMAGPHEVGRAERGAFDNSSHHGRGRVGGSVSTNTSTSCSWL